MLGSHRVRLFPELFAFTDGDVWRPGIGDPGFMGWVTVLVYFAVAILCLRNFLVARQSRRSRNEVAFWGVLGCSMILLGINKQLDLQTLLTLTVRRIALAQGWYEQRRLVQAVFVGIVALIGIATSIWLWRVVKCTGRTLRVPLAGFILLVCFVVVRAASFHHFDSLINLRTGGVRMNWILELGSLGIIAFGAWPHRNRDLIGHGGSPPQNAPVLP